MREEKGVLRKNNFCPNISNIRRKYMPFAKIDFLAERICYCHVQRNLDFPILRGARDPPKTVKRTKHGPQKGEGGRGKRGRAPALVSQSQGPRSKTFWSLPLDTIGVGGHAYMHTHTHMQTRACWWLSIRSAAALGTAAALSTGAALGTATACGTSAVTRGCA